MAERNRDSGDLYSMTIPKKPKKVDDFIADAIVLENNNNQ